MKVPKSLMRKKTVKMTSKLNSARRRSQAKCQLEEISYIKELLNNCYWIVLVCAVYSVINILLTELSRSAWENLNLGLGYRPKATSVEILSYRPLVITNLLSLIPNSWLSPQFLFPSCYATIRTICCQRTVKRSYKCLRITKNGILFPRLKISLIYLRCTLTT